MAVASDGAGSDHSVVLDQDVYEFVLRNAVVIGEGASSILRRLLDLPASNGGRAAAQPSATSQRSDDLMAFLRGGVYRTERNVTDRVLAILAFLYRSDPTGFEQVLQIRGRKRVYFARSKDEIEASGRSTFPRQIPGSPYWAMTNTDTVQKKEILLRVLKVLGYDRSAIQAMWRVLG